jgi:hypothetical protein
VIAALDIRSAAGTANRALVLDYLSTPCLDGQITLSLTSNIAGVFGMDKPRMTRIVTNEGRRCRRASLFE